MPPRTSGHRARIAVGSILLAVLLVGGAVACSSDDSADATTTTTTGAGEAGHVEPDPDADPVTREILARYPAPNAPGQELYLYRVTVQPGAQLASHYHPGTQLARVEQGELTYSIEEGTVPVGRDGAEEPTEEATGPTELTLAAGDTVYETEDVVHHAANDGDEVVVIILSTLITEGEELSITVDDSTTTTAAP